MTERKFDPEEWEVIMVDVLTEQPELASATVRGMQAGILAALDRRSERLATVSLGLHEALTTKPNHARRHSTIVEAIEASTLHPTKWSAEAIAKETPDA